MTERFFWTVVAVVVAAFIGLIATTVGGWRTLMVTSAMATPGVVTRVHTPDDTLRGPQVEIAFPGVLGARCHTSADAFLAPGAEPGAHVTVYVYPLPGCESTLDRSGTLAGDLFALAYGVLWLLVAASGLGELLCPKVPA